MVYYQNFHYNLTRANVLYCIAGLPFSSPFMQVLVHKSRSKESYFSDSATSPKRHRRRKTWRSMDEYMTGSMTVATPAVPPYSLWVEGDNRATSRDSALHGPVSKKLLIGIAEYRVWPPWRVGKLDNSADSLLVLPTKDVATTRTKYNSLAASVVGDSADNNINRYRSRSYWPWKQA